jgi:hypothetical protein
VWEDGENNNDIGDKYIFLFKNLILITDRKDNNGEVLYHYYATIKVKICNKFNN